MATSAKEMARTRVCERYPWLTQLDWTLKKAGMVSGVFFLAVVFFCSSYVKVQEPDEPEPERLNITHCKYYWKIRCGSIFVTSHSRVVSLLLKLAYNSCPLKFSSKEGWNYADNTGEVGKLRTTRSKKTSQILGLRPAKVLLASGEVTSDDNGLAMALSSGSKDLDDRI